MAGRSTGRGPGSHDGGAGAPPSAQGGDAAVDPHLAAQSTFLLDRSNLAGLNEALAASGPTSAPASAEEFPAWDGGMDFEDATAVSVAPSPLHPTPSFEAPPAPVKETATLRNGSAAAQAAAFAKAAAAARAAQEAAHDAAKAAAR